MYLFNCVNCHHYNDWQTSQVQKELVHKEKNLDDQVFIPDNEHLWSLHSCAEFRKVPSPPMQAIKSTVSSYLLAISILLCLERWQVHWRWLLINYVIAWINTLVGFIVFPHIKCLYIIWSSSSARFCKVDGGRELSSTPYSYLKRFAKIFCGWSDSPVARIFK